MSKKTVRDRALELGYLEHDSVIYTKDYMDYKFRLFLDGAAIENYCVIMTESVYTLEQLKEVYTEMERDLLELKKYGLPKLTVAEKSILESLPFKYKYIARNKWGDLEVYSTKPTKLEDQWACIKTETIWDLQKENLSVFNHLFKFITWEDEMPYAISSLLGV